jgi:SAM-dependent methyltransferase
VSACGPDLLADERLHDSIASYNLAHASYAERYRHVDFSDLHERFLAGLRTAGPILDAGCGAGRDLSAFEERQVAIVGLDRSQGMLRESSAVAGSPLACGDIRSLPFASGVFGGVWSMASIVHLNQADSLEAISEFRRVLQSGGLAFLSVPCGAGSEWRDDGYGGRRWFSYFTEPDVERLLSAAGFQVEWLVVQAGVAAKPWINALARAT